MRLPWVSRKKYEELQAELAQENRNRDGDARAFNVEMKRMRAELVAGVDVLKKAQVFSVDPQHDPESLLTVRTCVSADMAHHLIAGSEAALDYLIRNVGDELRNVLRPLIYINRLPRARRP